MPTTTTTTRATLEDRRLISTFNGGSSPLDGPLGTSSITDFWWCVKKLLRRNLFLRLSSLPLARGTTAQCTCAPSDPPKAVLYNRVSNLVLNPQVTRSAPLPPSPFSLTPEFLGTTESPSLENGDVVTPTWFSKRKRKRDSVVLQKLVVE
jgi:hypothetical protein